MQYQGQGQPGQPHYPPGQPHAGQPIHAQPGQPFQAGAYQQPQGQPHAPPGYGTPPTSPYQPGYQQGGYQQPGYQPGYAPPTYPQPSYGGIGTPYPVYAGVRVPMLISAILNILTALWWMSTIILSFIALLPIGLLIMEFICFSKLNGRNPPWQYKGMAIAIGILEILSAGYFNGLSWVCGIVVLCNVGKLSPPMGAMR